jgi:hypothetical protein
MYLISLQVDGTLYAVLDACFMTPPLSSIILGRCEV